MIISMKVTKEEHELIKRYAEIQRTTVSDVLRTAILEKIEDEFDIFLFNEAYQEYEKNNQTYTITEAKKILGIK